ncbi:MAG: BtpA/SgcQ family protein [Clostridiaceae bacterium]
MRFTDIFPGPLPILGMLHLKGGSPADILECAIRESDIMYAAGVDAVIVEDYFGSADDAERVLKWLSENRRNKVYGVNILDDFPRSYEFARRYGARFMQVDSVAGHLRPQDDTSYGEMIAGYRADGSILVLGGVRFKYQPYLSGRTLAEDLEIGRTRCDAIVVTGVGTGVATDIQKIRGFREILGSFPLIVGAGVTVQNAAETLLAVDGAIVGSAFKAGGLAENEMDAAGVAAFMTAVRALRQDMTATA